MAETLTELFQDQAPQEVDTLSSLFVDVPGASPENPKQEQMVSATHRHFTKMYGDSPQQVANGLMKLGYQAQINSKGNVAVRRNPNQPWGVVDPSGWRGFGELGKDVIDWAREAGDISAVVGGAMGGGAAGSVVPGVGTIAGGIAGGAAGAATYETGRQLEAQRLGFKEEFEEGSVALSTGLAALPGAKYIPGMKQVGAVVGRQAGKLLPGLTKATVYGLGEEVVETGVQRVGRAMVGAGEILEAPGRALTKVGEEALQRRTVKQFEDAYDMVTKVVHWAKDLGLPREMVKKVERQAMRLKFPLTRFPATYSEIDNAIKSISDYLVPVLQEQISKRASIALPSFFVGMKIPGTKKVMEEALEKILKISSPEHKKLLEKFFGLPFQVLAQRLIGRFGGPVAGFATAGWPGALVGVGLKVPGVMGTGLRSIGWKLVDNPQLLQQWISKAPAPVAKALQETLEVIARNPAQKNVAINSLLMNTTAKQWLLRQEEE